MSERTSDLVSWLSSGDPGGIRRYAAVRAALAVLSAWLVMRTVVNLLAGRSMPTVVLFTVVSCIFCFLIIIDARPNDRRLSWVLAIVPFVLGLVLATLVASVALYGSLALLGLMFLSYLLRRYGVRAGQLALLATMALYFGTLVRPSPSTLPWFSLAALVGVLLAGLWEFVLMPYNPVVSLRRGVADFYHQTSVAVGQIASALDAAAQGSESDLSNARRSLRGIRHCRSVIDGLGSGAVSPSLWTDARLKQLQVDLYTSEQGLELMIEGATGLVSVSAQVPSDVREALRRALVALQSSLSTVATPDSVDESGRASEALRRRASAAASAGQNSSWAFPLLRVLGGGYELARAVAHSRSVDPSTAQAWAEASPVQSAASEASGPVGMPGRAATSPPPGPQKRAWHPTTLLGLQAVLAVGLAMLIAWLLGLSHGNWVFWTAFLVIAGSTGESLRRISMRVAATVGGAVAGAVLVLILPDDLIVSVLMVILCLSLAIYAIPVSYPGMVFWSTVAVVVIFTLLGGTVQDILIWRPTNTLIGALAAALVVAWILPIRIRDRFVAGVAGFLGAADAYLGEFASALSGRKPPGDLNAEALKVSTAFARLEQTFPSLAFEYNQLTRAQSELATHTTTLAALNGYLAGLAKEATGVPRPVTDPRTAEAIIAVRERIHDNIGALNRFLKGDRSAVVRTLADLTGSLQESSPLDDLLVLAVAQETREGVRALFYLARINEAIVQVAAGLGVPVQAGASA